MPIAKTINVRGFRLPFAAAGIALAAALASARADDADFKREQDLSEKEGQPAPALEVKDWMNTPDGEPLELEKLKGKVVVIDFWGTW